MVKDVNKKRYFCAARGIVVKVFVSESPGLLFSFTENSTFLFYFFEIDTMILIKLCLLCRRKGIFFSIFCIEGGVGVGRFYTWNFTVFIRT